MNEPTAIARIANAPKMNGALLNASTLLLRLVAVVGMRALPR